ncbi:hypothetical protein A2867_02085 [Candidatus Daviesbacteria bacterium RIFCSPHIGHO2_01_FULL_40_11]|uniref:DUF4258 domain-containing protein n=1 Tax=Candidatus Daviesbacteria bacterium RIFCSPHIGHO2_01_FULL_40_11 TaxID=1797762 RepID=A0A1F5JLU0_9BACT|nr:MAG: hypothetical protein A2867_02085 [Candidatus Daviesbacteria bacterium RIFCSPHIGHO2_01_FULL_40_11]
MKIIFSDHAKNQKFEREIAKKLILETIRSPQNRFKSFRNRELLQRQFGDKILEVVTVKEGENLVVITQYWLEKEEV